MNRTSVKIPKNWEIKPLEEVCDILIGGTPARNNPEYWDVEKITSNVWVSIADLSKLENKYISDSSEYITDLGARKSNVKLIPADTVIMSFKLSIGKTAITARPLYTNEAIAAFLPKGKHVAPKFLYYALPTLAYETDTAVKGKTLNKEKLRKSLFILPTKHEQELIAEILESVDNDLEKTDAVIKKTELLRKSLMHQLLTRGINKDKFKKTKIGEIPEDWRLSKISEVTTLITKGTTPTTYGHSFVDEGVNFVKIEAITESGEIDYSKLSKITEETHSFLRRSQLQTGDVLFSIAGVIGRSAVVQEKLLPANTNQALAIIRPNQSLISSYFLRQVLNSQLLQKQAKNKQVQAAQANVSLSEMGNMEIALPPQGEQIKIAELLTSLDEKISLNKQLKNKLYQLKKGLMSDLLSGKVKVE